jgi:hypothetical protein
MKLSLRTLSFKTTGRSPNLLHWSKRTISRNYSFQGEIRSGWFSFGTPKATLVERPQTDVEQFLAMLRFENRSKVEELLCV